MRHYGTVDWMVATLFVCLANFICSDSIGADEQSRAESKETVETRMVWVLSEQALASEGGSMSSGPSAVVPYEIKCAVGQLRSAQRSMVSRGLYGTATWTIRVPGAVGSSEGARNLQAALERICTM